MIYKEDDVRRFGEEVDGDLLEGAVDGAVSESEDEEETLAEKSEEEEYE